MQELRLSHTSRALTQYRSLQVLSLAQRRERAAALQQRLSVADASNTTGNAPAAPAGSGAASGADAAAAPAPGEWLTALKPTGTQRRTLAEVNAGSPTYTGAGRAALAANCVALNTNLGGRGLQSKKLISCCLLENQCARTCEAAFPRSSVLQATLCSPSSHSNLLREHKRVKPKAHAKSHARLQTRPAASACARWQRAVLRIMLAEQRERAQGGHRCTPAAVLMGCRTEPAVLLRRPRERRQRAPSGGVHRRQRGAQPRDCGRRKRRGRQRRHPGGQPGARLPCHLT